jgi:hypothetical protein
VVWQGTRGIASGPYADWIVLHRRSVLEGVMFPVETFGTLLDNKSSTITVTK